jgi:hypothetical protein
MTSQSPLIEDMLEGQQRHQQMSIAEKFNQHHCWNNNKDDSVSN